MKKRTITLIGLIWIFLLFCVGTTTYYWSCELFPSLQIPEVYHGPVIIRPPVIIPPLNNQIPFHSWEDPYNKQVICLTKNVYWESKSQSNQGMLAVAYVTMNRVHHWHSSVCRIVYQRGQFSWVDNGWHGHNSWLWQRAQKAAMKAYYHYNKKEDPSHNALYFHANYVDPKWHGHVTAIIGDHLFYNNI